MHTRKTIGSGRWITAGVGTHRRIYVAPFCGGWVVGEAALDNSQFFNSRPHAEAAARNLGERLAGAGDPSEISIRLANGESGDRFVIAAAGRSETLVS